MRSPTPLPRYIRLLRMLLPFAFAACQSSADKPADGGSPSAPAGEPTTAFVAVNVLPMTGPQVLPEQTVLVRGGRIVALGPAGRTAIPPDARRIDGRNKYLMPGLTDFHVHFPPDTADHAGTLRLFLGNGITTVVNMEGNPALLRLRRRIARGEVPGPTLFTTGPFLNRPLVTTPAEVERAVVAQRRAGYDFIKLHGELSREAYARLVETARREGIRVVGHVPANLGIEAVLAARQPLIVHAEEYLYAYFSFRRDLPTSAEEIDSMARRVAAATARAGT